MLGRNVLARSSGGGHVTGKNPALDHKFHGGGFLTTQFLLRPLLSFECHLRFVFEKILKVQNAHLPVLWIRSVKSENTLANFPTLQSSGLWMPPLASHPWPQILKSTNTPPFPRSQIFQSLDFCLPLGVGNRSKRMCQFVSRYNTFKVAKCCWIQMWRILCCTAYAEITVQFSFSWELKRQIG